MPPEIVPSAIRARSLLDRHVPDELAVLV